MPKGFLSLTKFLSFGHRWVTVSSNLGFSCLPRHRLSHLEALLSQGGHSANSPGMQCGKSLGRPGSIAPSCPAWPGGAEVSRAASIDIDIYY